MDRIRLIMLDSMKRNAAILELEGLRDENLLGMFGRETSTKIEHWTRWSYVC
ncbi:hypothetical protein MUK42_31349 [Musa troglodytarum]|uniref:Uncharacterized protein n=1 Tax=Musa troglodytarum TaxID=320322 RepID=A0A9E7K096_9LILI|nr:hypothetical protein MUK42_31349 [Musa troglodytarum]